MRTRTRPLQMQMPKLTGIGTSIAALAPPTLAAAALLEPALLTTAPDSNNAPQAFYTAHDLDAHCFTRSGKAGDDWIGQGHQSQPRI